MDTSPATTMVRSDKVAVIFDLDGTLIDFEGLSEECLNAVLAAEPRVDVAKRVSRALHNSIIGMNKHDWSRAILSALDIPDDVMTPEAYATGVTNALATRYGEIVAMPSAPELVADLKAKGVRMAVATSSDTKQCHSKLSHHPWLLPHLDVIVCGDQVARGKPHPDIFLEAARQLNIDPSCCVVVEDSPHGAQAGVAAGMVTVAVLDDRFAGNDPRTLAMLPRDAIRVANIGEVADVIQARFGVAIR
jgi:HAD superfamily hydrolase (TIGR01509 family)